MANIEDPILLPSTGLACIDSVSKIVVLRRRAESVRQKSAHRNPPKTYEYLMFALDQLQVNHCVDLQEVVCRFGIEPDQAEELKLARTVMQILHKTFAK